MTKNVTFYMFDYIFSHGYQINQLDKIATRNTQGCASARKFANICEFVSEICEFDLKN